jgi:hypothetical protein
MFGRNDRPLGALACAAFLVMFTATAHGALLVYDGFDYTLGEQLSYTGTGGNATPANAWSGGTGFDGNSRWGIGSTAGVGTHTATIVPNLSFSWLVTGGNAVSLDSPGIASVLLSRPLDVPVASGALWSSYLYQPTSATDAAVVRVNTQQFAGAGTAKFQNCGAVSGKTYGGVSGGEGLATNADGPVLANANTYLLIAKFDNVGQSGSATWWALSETNFTSLVSAGISEANLGLYCTDTVTATGQASQTLAVTDFLNLYTYRGTSLYDEIRFGTSLADVVPVPEPSALVLLGVGMVGLLSRTRRRRR